jgi:outer membrane receptor for ferrienterochelin and colicins
MGEQLLYQYLNVSRARTRGVELSAGATLVEGLTAELGYTFTDASDLKHAVPLNAQSHHRGFGQVRWRMKRWGLTATLRCSVTGEAPIVDTDTIVDKIPAFVMLDARVAKTFGSHVEVFVAGMNLGGAGGVTFPIPPRTVFAGLSVKN